MYFSSGAQKFLSTYQTKLLPQYVPFSLEVPGTTFWTSAETVKIILPYSWHITSISLTYTKYSKLVSASHLWVDDQPLLHYIP